MAYLTPWHVACLARFVIAGYFIFFVFWNYCHRKQAIPVMKQNHIPFAPAVFYFGLLLMLVASLLIILNQYLAIAAAALIIFDITATFIFHRFWQFSNPDLRALNTIIFITNLSMTIGGLLLLLSMGL
jgi:uncharacterized membrane protein YphA (DoxX/SURF4 family)